MSWTKRWKRACAGGIAFAMRGAQGRCISGKNAPNICITQGDDGIITWYGAEEGSFGTINPNETVEGQLIHAIKWNASGDFIMSFGSLGNEQVTDTDIILVDTADGVLSLIWNSTTGVYEGSDLALATELINDYVEGEELCIYARIVPNLFISYNFELLRGTA